MGLAYRAMYRIGLTPWDHDEVPGWLTAVAEGEDALPPGRALDLGCGSGRDAVYLARRGWQVTGVDAVPLALSRAAERARQAAVTVRWVPGDVSELEDLELGDDHTLLLDFGCFHGLTDPQRSGAAAGMSKLAAPGATLLLFAFEPGRRGPARAAWTPPSCATASPAGSSPRPGRRPRCSPRDRCATSGRAGTGSPSSRRRSEQLGQQPGGSRPAAELLDDGGGDHLGRGGGVVHPAAGPLAVEPVADVKALLEVAGEREVEERPPVGGQLHGGGQAALDHGQVAGGQVAAEPVDERADLQPVVAREGGRVDAGAGHHDHAQGRRAPLGLRVGGDHPPQQRLPHPRAAHGHDADLLVGVVAELVAEGGPVGHEAALGADVVVELAERHPGRLGDLAGRQPGVAVGEQPAAGRVDDQRAGVGGGIRHGRILSMDASSDLFGHPHRAAGQAREHRGHLLLFDSVSYSCRHLPACTQEVILVAAIRVLPSELEAAAGRLQASADQVRSVVGTLCPAAPGIEAALGDPGLAERFTAAWNRWASQLGAIADDLNSAAARLQVAAHDYRATDRAAVPPGPGAR